MAGPWPVNRCGHNSVIQAFVKCSGYRLARVLLIRVTTLSH